MRMDARLDGQVRPSELETVGRPFGQKDDPDRGGHGACARG